MNDLKIDRPLYLPKFWSVSLYGEPFSRYKVVKIRNAPNDLEMKLKTLTVESTLHTVTTYPWGPILLRFALWPATFYNSPLSTMLNGQKKNKKKKIPQIQNFKFYNYLF